MGFGLQRNKIENRKPPAVTKRANFLKKFGDCWWCTIFLSYFFSVDFYYVESLGLVTRARCAPHNRNPTTKKDMKIVNINIEKYVL